MRTRTLLAAAAVVAVVAVAGCTNNNEDEATPSPSPSPTETVAPAGTIVTVAAQNPDFTTLVAAVGAAGLADTLNAEGPYTVFAPTNEAFAALGQPTIDALLLPENKAALTDILTYHVVAGDITSDQIQAGDVATVEGQNVTITTDNGGVQVNGATVTTADVDASNGVIHVIDAVLLPPDFDPATLVQPAATPAATPAPTESHQS